MARRSNPSAKRGRKELKWPVSGIARNKSYQGQGPFTTHDAVNVRTRGAIESRERGGSRPGLEKSHYTQLGLEDEDFINLINQVNTTSDDQFTHWEDTFQASELGDIWNLAAGFTEVPLVLPSDLSAVINSVTAGGVVRDVLVPAMDVTIANFTSIKIIPFEAEHFGTYQIFIRLDDAAPNPFLDGVVVTINLLGKLGVVSGNITSYVAGVPTVTAFDQNLNDDDTALPGWLTVIDDGDQLINAEWRGKSLIAAGHAIAVPVTTETRTGFSMQASVPEGRTLVDTFRLEYGEISSSEFYRTFFVAAAGGFFYFEDRTNHMVFENNSAKLNKVDQLSSVERGQKLYVADHGIATSGVDGVVQDGANLDRLTSVVIGGGWIALDLDNQSYIVTLFDATGDYIDGQYAINDVQAGYIMLDRDFATGTAGMVSFRIDRIPKVFNPATGALDPLTPTAGLVPVSCQVVVRYRDRLVWGVCETDPSNWFMSALARPLDYAFEYNPQLPTTAVSGTEANAGLVGDRIRTLCPFGDEFLVFGCENSIWTLQGDPQFDGHHQNISQTVGMLSQQAWDWGPEGELWFMSREGLFVMPHARAHPQSISHEKLPEELKQINTSIFLISLTWDIIERSVHIYITSRDTGQRDHWVYVPRDKAFWRYDLTNLHDPTFTFMRRAHITSDTTLILGCHDGFLRRYNRLAESDDGFAFNSFIEFGPFQLGNGVDDGKLKKLIGVMAEDGGDVDWSVRVGDSSRAAVDALGPLASGNWPIPGRNHNAMVRARGSAAVVRLQTAESARSWSFESIIAEVGAAGMSRVG